MLNRGPMEHNRLGGQQSGNGRSGDQKAMRIISITAGVYDGIRLFWDRRETSRRVSLVLLVFFIVVAILILVNKVCCLPPQLARLLPTDPFAAVRLAFNLVLAVEVLELIFALSDSIASAVGKQLEIMALLLLRESFVDISLLNSHVALEKDGLILLQIGLSAISGLALFVIRSQFTKWQYIHSYRDMQAYVTIKKCISLFLLFVFCCALWYDAYKVIVAGEQSAFFEIFYTALIFMDILLVLVGQYFAPSFQATFRNSGFAVSTLLMRIAIGAPHLIASLICVFAGIYLLVLSWALFRHDTLQRKSP